LFSRFEEISIVRRNTKKKWTKETDEIIEKFWKTKDRECFVKLFSECFFPACKEVLRKRYISLVQRAQ